MQSRKYAVIVLALGALMLEIFSPVAMKSQVVRTEQGMAQGKPIRTGKASAFLGLPYASPPVGDLRWKPPASPVAWKGLRDATQFGHRCEQWQIWADYLFLDPGPSEDCLYLNVYVPAAAKAGSKLPVMFWIHGGGYTAGAASEPRYTDSPLVEKNVVLVTINYRLGVFGFLSTKDLAAEGDGHAGNYALMDMVAALHWTKQNIAAFGGDPGNVTIFGESAGSFAVSTLLAASSARGLFHKAIGESGAVFSDVLPLSTLAERTARDQEWTDSLGTKNLAGLRALPTGTIIEAASKKPVGWFSPIIDGRLITESVPDTYSAGKQAHVPTIIGWNHDERTATLSKKLTVEKWKAFAAEHYGPRAAEFLAAFPGATDQEAKQSADAYTTAGFIAESAWKWAEAQAHTGAAPVYRYRFDLPAPPSDVHPEGKYAFHSDELEYVFGTLDTRRGATWRPQDRKLSQQIIEYWTNFARTGDPNGSGLPPWPRYDTAKQLIYLDDMTTTGQDKLLQQYTFLSK